MKNKKAIIIAISIIGTILLGIVTFGNQGFLDMYRLYRQDAESLREIDAAKAAIDSLKAEIELLKSDTAYIEKVARERLGMARKGEIIYKFVDEE